MAVSQDILEADKKARVALLDAITSEVPRATVNQLSQLAQAYNYVTSSDAPRDPSKVRTGSIA